MPSLVHATQQHTGPHANVRVEWEMIYRGNFKMENIGKQRKRNHEDCGNSMWTMVVLGPKRADLD